VYKKLLIQFVVSLAIAAFFLWLTAQNMVEEAGQHLDGPFLSELQRSVASVPIGLLVLYGFLFLAVHVSRILRWQFLIKPLGEHNWRKVFRICAVGFSAIVILPLRLGEMVRPYMLSRESKVSMSAALGTAVVERVLDGLLITGLLFLSLWVYGGPNATPVVVGSAYVALAIFAGALTVLVLAASHHHLTVRLLEGTLGRLSPRLCKLVISLVDRFLDGVRVLRRNGVLLPFLGLTVAYWGLNGLGIALLAQGFGFEISVWQGYALLSILCVGIMIPAGPGFFGNFQYFLSQGLLLFFAAPQVAAAGLAFGLTLNTIQFVLQVGFGVPFYLASHFNLKKLVEGSAMQQVSSPSEAPTEPEAAEVAERGSEQERQPPAGHSQSLTMTGPS
jgi:uncharacterized protein (TIRG00374 family)